MSWRWVGDRAILVEFPEPSVSDSNAAARALHARMAAHGFPEVEDLVPAARSLLVLLRPGAEPGNALVGALSGRGASPANAPPAPEARTITVRVRYGGEDGPDLANVAQLHDLSDEEVVRQHSSVTYTVGFLGFTPGFAYLLGLPPELETPRLDTPRTRVPTGSVAIGGPFTGVYPSATPGGWRLIGRTEARLFDPRRDPPCLLSPGDRVRFEPA